MGLGCFQLVVCVDSAAVCQFYELLRCNFFVLGILLAAIKKRGHDSESEMTSKSPFHGLARTAPCNDQGERFGSYRYKSIMHSARQGWLFMRIQNPAWMAPLRFGLQLWSCSGNLDSVWILSKAVVTEVTIHDFYRAVVATNLYGYGWMGVSILAELTASFAIDFLIEWVLVLKRELIRVNENWAYFNQRISDKIQQ